MKKHIILLFLAAVICFSCKKETEFTYNAEDNIYLDYPNSDTLTYSFSTKPNIEKDTVWINVKISGTRENRDRKFAMSVVSKTSTAISGVHFEPLKEYYVMPKDSGTVRVPIILKNTDPALVEKSVNLAVKVDGGEDFNSNLPEAKRTKSIIFSNRLEQPSWWMYWGQLRNYSRTKHQLFLIVNGPVALADMSKPDAFMEIPRTLYYIENLRVFVTYPLTWVAQHADSGYEVKLRTDGSGDYDFYNTNAPTKKFHIKYFPAANEYVFLDENGNQIKM
ncbi:DUF4843 domain-containing protein [Pedobacter insulae]|uniref:DUF4843 domain-containing protein n=1 Tax=Pedobacter insulae TaxID=414048 RepID=A0A1I2Z8T3_9SPHI|nr:DUF4843 domain-containing protein [Pedobacter insulae]SFH33985.1 protein of unknown function [Pedobacter insulae]